MSNPSPFEILSDILRPYAASMTVKTDNDSNFYLEECQSTGEPRLFGAAQIKKRYTSFHLMPVYCHRKLLETISPALRKRMQGKSCFNFTRAEQIPQEELRNLVERSFASL